MNKPKKYAVLIDGRVYHVDSKPELNKLLTNVTSSLGAIFGDSVSITVSIRGD